jgi:hypothetical protein
MTDEGNITDAEARVAWEAYVDASMDAATSNLDAMRAALLAASRVHPAGEPRPLDEWIEDYGDVVWWCWRDGEWLGEPSYIGTPLDLGQTVEVELRSNQGEFVHQHQVGGWPGYHTHWTPHPLTPGSPL